MLIKITKADALTKLKLRKKERKPYVKLFVQIRIFKFTNS